MRGVAHVRIAVHQLVPAGVHHPDRHHELPLVIRRVHVPVEESQLLRVANLEPKAEPGAIEVHRGEVRLQHLRFDHLIALDLGRLALQFILLGGDLLAEHLELLGQILAELLRLSRFLLERVELRLLVLLPPGELLGGGREVLLALDEGHVLLLRDRHVGLVHGHLLLHRELASRHPHLDVAPRLLELLVESVQVDDVGDIV